LLVTSKQTHPVFRSLGFARDDSFKAESRPRTALAKHGLAGGRRIRYAGGAGEFQWTS